MQNPETNHSRQQQKQESQEEKNLQEQQEIEMDETNLLHQNNKGNNENQQQQQHNSTLAQEAKAAELYGTTATPPGELIVDNNSNANNSSNFENEPKPKSQKNNSILLPSSSYSPSSSPSSSSFDLCLDKFRNLSRKGLGIFLIILVAFIWVSSSEFLQFVFGDENFDKPFFVTYFNTMSFALWMFGFACPGASGFGSNPTWRKKEEIEQKKKKKKLKNQNRKGKILLPSSDPSDQKQNNDQEEQQEEGVEEDDDDNQRGNSSLSSSSNNNNNRTSRRRTVVSNTPPSVKSEMQSSHSLANQQQQQQQAPPPPPPSPFGNQQPQNQKQVEGETKSEKQKQKNELGQEEEEQEEEEEEHVEPYSIAQIAFAAFLFCPLWFLANVLFNYSLSRTSVASNTILSSTSTIWAMVFSRLLLKERVTVRKCIALALSFGGAAMVGFGDSDNSSSSESEDKASMVGNILAGVSAMFYAAYTTVLRHNLPDERRYPIGMCFAFVGVFNALFLWPGLILLNLLGVEGFEWPSAKVTGFLILNGLVGTNLSDILWAKSVILTSPVVATLGLSLTIPVAMLADLALKGKWHSALYLCGALCVTCGFVVANWKSQDEEAEDELQHKQEVLEVEEY